MSARCLWLSFLCLALVVPAAQAADSNIAYAATVTASPAVQDDLFADAVDGRVTTGLTYAVGTKGEGTITLTFTHPRPVSGVRLYQNSAVYYATKYVLEADVTGQGDFATVLAQGEEFPLNQWVEHRWAPRPLRAVRFRSLAGVSNGSRAHPIIGEFEVLGVPEASDLQAAVERGIVVSQLPAVRPLRRVTPLTVNGRPPALLLPAGAEYDAARRELMKGLAAYKPEVVTTVAEADPAHRTVICLGSMLTNPLLERLYWNQYTYVNAATPGPGNYLLHVVYDPYPYSGGQDVIVVGCSDAAGALPAVRALLKHLQAGELPYVVEGGPGELVPAAEAQKIAATKPNPTFEDFTKAVQGFLRTGCEAYARKAAATLDVVAPLYAPGGIRSGSEAHNADILPWNEEITSFDINLAWDAFEESPLLSDAQRLAASNAFLKFTRDLVGNCSDWGSLDADSTVAWNHTTFPLLGIYGGARYFHRYYPLSDMPKKLEAAKYCFLAQARSWKPQEDSDAYVTYVPEHTARYCLAEEQMEFFQGGNMKRFADYLVGICDNLGLGSGFGDSGLSARADFILDEVPMAYWWTRDPGYLWLMDRYTTGKGDRGYDRGLAPVRPDRFCGLNVFPLDAQIYAYHQKNASYNERLTPAEVPAAEAFDKISFRESWEPEAQYLLLDGFGRGKHLHFDTNSIIEFVEGGERWLLDHDYLVRNTTEHNMLTVLRDGRADALVPSMAGLTARADLPGLGYTDTYVKAYNGCDWQRQVLWNRGEYFLVADTVTARTAGDYDLELTWKTLDEAGRQSVKPGGDFVAERGVGAAETANCALIDDPDASGGKAYLLDQAGSRLAFGADLPAGEYKLALYAYGLDSSSDSLWLSVDLGPKTAFHIGQGKYVASSSTAAKTDPTPTVKLEGKGPHLIVVTMREAPPIKVDRFVFTDAAGKETVYEAEKLPPAPRPDQDLTRSFHIKPATPLAAWVTNHERVGISAPISMLHQRQSGTLQPGQTVRFASLVYTSLPQRRRDLQPVRLTDELLALRGRSPALALLGPVAYDKLQVRAAAGLLAADELRLAGLRRATIGDLSLTATAPVDLQVNLKTGQATAVSAKDAQLQVAVGGKRQAFTIGATAKSFSLKPLLPASQAVALITQLARDARPAAAAASATAAAKAAAPAWTAFSGSGKIACLKTVDLHDGGGPRLLVGRNQTVHCLDASGRELWQYVCQGTVKDLAAGDLRPEPGDEVVVGCGDTYAYVLSAAGQFLDKYQMRGTPWARNFGDNAYSIFNVGVWDLNADGRPEIAVTMKNFDLQVYSADWKLLWKNDYALHGSKQLDFVDTSLDGKPDLLFVGDKYGSAVGISGAGKRLYSAYTSIGDTVFAVGDVDGDGKTEVVSGSSTGDLVCTPLANSGDVRWRFDNFGYPVNHLATADLNGDGKAEVLVSSGTGYLYVLDGQGQVLWQDRAGVTVNQALPRVQDGARQVAYADESGLLRVADGAGKALEDLRPGSPPRLLSNLPTAGGMLLVAALADGRVVAYPW